MYKLGDLVAEYITSVDDEIFVNTYMIIDIGVEPDFFSPKQENCTIYVIQDIYSDKTITSRLEDLVHYKYKKLTGSMNDEKVQTQNR